MTQTSSAPLSAAKPRDAEPAPAPARGLPDNLIAPVSMERLKLGESLLLDGANKVREEETVFKESNDHYEWVVILQNREGKYFWFRYLSNAPALFKETSLSIVNVLTKGKDISPTHHSEPTEVKA